MQCVDCVAEGRRAAPQARSAFGAALHPGRPVVTLTIIGLSVVSYLLQWVVGDAWTGALVFAPVAGWHEPYRFLTSAFVHSTGSVFHILFNMYALWVVGPVLERQVGRWRFIAVYLLSAVAGSTGYLLLATPAQWFTGVLGASGAVFGLLGAVLLVMRRVGGNARGVLVLIVINGVLGVVVPGIAWQAHLGGLVAGVLLAAGYVYAPRDRRTVVGVVVTGAVAAALLVAIIARYLTL